MVNVFKVIASGFVRNDQGQLLVVRRSEDEESFPGMLAIPGGTIEVEETGILEVGTVENNLVREILEETNVKVEVIDWVESTCLVKDNKAKLYLFFNCKLVGNEKKLTSSEETPEVFWADISSIDMNQCTPTLKKYIQNA
jgi:8-oxo-dGTP pyrophosphatase MutT (NUDIX family)